MKTRAKILTMILEILALSTANLSARTVTIKLTAEVTRVDDYDDLLEGTVNIGDIITGSYTFDSSTPDNNPMSSLGAYWHYSPLYGINLSVGVFVFQTDPDNVELLLGIDNGTYGHDSYQIASHNNLPLSNGVEIGNILWLLDDGTSTALSSDALPIDPPVLEDWEINDLHITFGYKGASSIQARVTSAIGEPAIIFVDDDGPADFNNIQAAINNSNDGDTIIVADGTYTGFGNRDIDFLGKAIVLRSANGPEDCIIDSQGSEVEYHRGFYFHSGEDANSVLDGFTITNGYAHYGGGAIHCSLSSPMITNCTIRGNVAPVRFFPGPFYGTFVFNNGGGIYCFRSSSVITNCYIVGNRVEGNGGGIGISDSSPLICNCVIAGNIALHKSFGLGGAIHSNHSSPTIINCTVIENVAEERGGGMYCLRTGSPTITNSIFWANQPNEIYVSTTAPSTLVVAYSNVQDFWPGEGNIDVDPCFTCVGHWEPNENPADPNDNFWVEGDYHLLRDSYCIDSGDPNYIAEPNATDLDGRPRIINGRIDMGAYEYSPTIQVYVRIVPRTISLASSGKWIAAFLRLPEEYNIADIEPNSIFLENEIELERFWLSEDNQIALIKFNCEKVQNILSVGETDLAITGQLTDGTLFEATDIIQVIDGGRKNN